MKMLNRWTWMVAAFALAASPHAFGQFDAYTRLAIGGDSAVDARFAQALEPAVEVAPEISAEPQPDGTGDSAEDAAAADQVAPADAQLDFQGMDEEEGQVPDDAAETTNLDDWFGPLGEDQYVGGRGLVSVSGMSGMFLNPTSGTLGEGQFTVQWCVWLSDGQLLPDGTNTGAEVWVNIIMASYGITDWLEVGFTNFVAIIDPSPFKGNGDDETLHSLGPFFRVRLIKDEQWWPEVSVGGSYFDGLDASSDFLARQEVFIAISKFFPIDPDGIFKGFRGHAGIRHLWTHDRDFGDANDFIGFIGGEIEFPYKLYLVSEVGTQSDVFGPKTPFAVGMQWRPNQVLGLSVAGAQTGGDDSVMGVFVGIGFNFEF